jgi:hypothetical protein
MLHVALLITNESAFIRRFLLRTGKLGFVSRHGLSADLLIYGTTRISSGSNFFWKFPFRISAGTPTGLTVRVFFQFLQAYFWIIR